jgi:hypothetical protein
MMKPSIGHYEDFKAQSLWLKKNKFKPDQVQTFYPSPMALATAMYYSGRNPLKKLHYKSERLHIPKKLEQRRLQKAFLRYHDPKNWPQLREALTSMGRTDLIGSGEQHLVPAESASARTNPASFKNPAGLGLKKGLTKRGKK